MYKFRVETKLKKYIKLNGLEVKAYSTYSLLKYLSMRYSISLFELTSNHKKGKLTFILLGKS